ncbi:TnsD family Tn7-like transposition protein [Sedimentibacter sp.]|uniref:TnsD family Tn7-like transposition protein n=1 Tax=Sedimentibacter sp. TaxID=1960295 RepID=UPI00289858CD|nr:TnsD family Tn7-like transposition protein [Sedimentibacter sp.]
MIEILPPFYPDELFYGWISRYRAISGNSSKMTVYNLFNRDKKVQFSIYYPHYLEWFCSYLSEYFNTTPEEIIEKHTIIPLFRPFVDVSEYQNTIISFIKEEYTTNSKKQINFRTKYNTQKFYYCKECFKEHYEKYGEYHINRMHQIPFNQICNEHLIQLSVFEIPLNVGKSELVDINDYDINYCDINDDSDSMKLINEEQINLSNDLNDLFSNSIENQNINLTTDKYDVMLQKKGYKIKCGNIDRIKLIKDFKSYYSEEFFKFIYSFDYEEDSNNKWLKFIGSEKCRHIHPLRHLLFIRFLFGSFYNFLTFNHLEEQSIIDVKLKSILLTSDSKLIYNSFNKSFLLIVRNALDLNILDECYYIIKKEKLNNIKIQRIRQEFLKYLSIVKVKDKEDLRRLLVMKFKIDFYILEIIDKDWLDNIITEYINKNIILPATILDKVTTSSKKEENWKERDIELNQKVIIAIEEIKKEVPLRQITKSYISKKIAFRLRKEYVEYIPKTMQLIENNIETKEVYKKRKIIFVIKQLINEGENVVISKISDRINISKDYQEFREFILDAIENIDKL